ncbi:MAG: chromosomal replication initiator protein DnaA [Tissierellia bacterium]|nr:chromosomal replication initiator protein DnaA [Tissierellia bacterium]
MHNIHSDLWDKACEILHNTLSGSSYNTWISTLNFLGESEIGKLVFETPTAFNKKIIIDRYKNMISDAIKEISGNVYELEFVCAEDPIPPRAVPQMKEELNPKYTFENFVIGKSNSFAQAACVAVAESPGKDYNPVFIYGASGLGKTHLMQAIGNFVCAENKDLKVVYASCEQFTNELINAIKNSTNQQFRDKYRNVDLLLIDDIQFLKGKDSTQEEFFHTFNALYPNKQIVVTSDKPPKELRGLEARLISRFEGGLICDIKNPDLETRIAILQKKAEIENLRVSHEVIEYIANNVMSNIRELEGALITVMAYASLTNNVVTLDIAEAALKDLMNKKPIVKIDATRIKDIVANHFNITVEDIDSKKRPNNIAYPRQIAMYITRELTDLSLPKIGGEFGGRDHSTVIHACDKISRIMRNDSNLKNTVEELIREIKGEI